LSLEVFESSTELFTGRIQRLQVRFVLLWFNHVIDFSCELFLLRIAYYLLC